MGWYCPKCGYAGFDEGKNHNCKKVKDDVAKAMKRVDKITDKFKKKIKEYGECLSTCHCGNQCEQEKFHTGDHTCHIMFGSECRWVNELDDYKKLNKIK